MNQLSPCPVDPKGLPSTTRIRELTSEEVDEVTGGVLPLIAVAAFVVLAAAAAEEGRKESSDAEDAGDGDD